MDANVHSRPPLSNAPQKFKSDGSTPALGTTPSNMNSKDNEMEFTYQSELDSLNNQGVTCPPRNAKASNTIGWRFVWNPLTSECAKPVASKNRKRFLSKPPYIQCSAWALSVYASEEEGRTAFAAFASSLPNFRKDTGDHIAALHITDNDGVCTPINRKNGHFDFHPYKHIDVVAKLTIAGNL